ncbi:hypothetical protein [Leptolyngbya sp. FACHB-16]|uniref:hypothetical protein n=1 Tax=unclassified Leptolyngbya TaxID=2650499 RepID=UPI00168686EE|nr:hypothetical protein [Leptolyngbya sp. FACHB-16]MBD2154409.1 hypothetical protein [Leptolyngbya sp. FACHB-16]
MALFKFPSRKPNSAAAPAAPPANRPKTLADLEQEINAAQPVMKPYRMEPQPARRRSGFGGKFFFLLLLLGRVIN